MVQGLIAYSTTAREPSSTMLVLPGGDVWDLDSTAKAEAGGTARRFLDAGVHR